MTADSGPSYKFALRLNSAGKLAAYGLGTTLLATGTTVLSSGTWYRIEVKVGTGNPAAWEVKINGTSEISGSSNVGTNQAASIAFGKVSDRNGNTVDFFYDDFLWSDAAYPGAGQCTVLLPTANGSNQTFTIGAGSGSHFQIVNERPPDGDTSYLLSPLVLNDLETEALNTAAGLSGTINSVKSCAILKRNASVNAAARVVLKSGTTTSTTTADYSSTSSYVGIFKLYDTDPNTSGAWTLAAANALESGAKDTSAVNQVRMTWTAAMVDYAPSAAPIGAFAGATHGVLGCGTY